MYLAMTVESSEESSKLQASVMAEHAGITLTDGQIDKYAARRLGYADESNANESSIDHVVHLLSDQQILDGLLDAGQRPKFRKSFPNIEFKTPETVVQTGTQVLRTIVPKQPEPKR